MKLLCLIIAFAVTALSAISCCNDQDCANQEYNVSSPVKSSPKEKDCKGCSPFFACGACNVFVTAQTFTHISLPIVAMPVKHNSIYQQPFIKDVARSIWQPPQLS